MFKFNGGKIVQLCEVMLLLFAPSVVTKIASEARRTAFLTQSLPQIIGKYLPHRMVLAHFVWEGTS